MSKLKDWETWATAAEQKALVRAAGTSHAHLFRQLANGHRSASAGLAGKIEAAAEKLRRASDGRLPQLTRADLCPACAECPYMKACAGASLGEVELDLDSLV